MTADNHLLPVYKRYPVELDHGQGAEVFDTDGRHYWDFLAGIGVNSLGYNHPALRGALEQSASLMHTSNLFWTRPNIDLSNRLAAITGGYLSLWANSGTEANEAAIKLMRRYGKTVDKTAILSLSGGFHGRTMGALAATFVPAYQDPFTPMVPQFFEVEAGNPRALEAAMEAYHPCGLMLEAIQGEGGVVPLPSGYLHEAGEIARHYGCLVLMDEVQTGIGRTGQWFGFQSEDVEPDIITLAKGLGGGVPIGAMLAKENVASYFQPGDHGSTFGGNPLASTAALAVLSWLGEGGGLAHVRAMSLLLEERLQGLVRDYPALVRGYRGRGLMWGIVVSVPAGEIVLSALGKGLILNAPKPHVIRLLPPLIIEEDAIAAFDAIMRDVLDAWDPSAGQKLEGV
jgi:acetylornithine/N-succinyldiaminopimelate aminotransferase